MAYIGNQPAESFTSFATQEFSTSATTSYTLNHAVTNENEIALFVNNVRQQPGSGKAYTATGTALTLSAATASTDTMYCVFLGRALQTVTPATNSITAAMVGNDLISGKDALASEPADTDEFLVSDAGTLKRIDYSLIKGGGITMIDNWRLTTSFQTGDANPISSNLERNDSSAPAFGYYGSQMSVSSGIWTFPSTGIYRIDAVAQFSLPGGNQYNGLNIMATANNSSYTEITSNNNFIVNVTNPTYSQTITNCMLDITDTTNQKVKFRIVNQNPSTTVLGDSTYDSTFFRFTRLGDT